MLRKHDQDLYRGNGKPALTVRMAVLEEQIKTMNKSIDEMCEDRKAIKRMIMASLLTTILAVAGDIIVKLVVH